MSGIIYRALCRTTNKSYVGQTTKTLSRRISTHKIDAKRGCKTKFYNAVRKYGWDSFEWSIVFSDVPLDQLQMMEDRGMEMFDTVRNGYNTIPSSGMSPMLLPEVAAKVSTACIGRIPWNRGIPRTAEEKRKIGDANRGKKRTSPSPMKGTKLSAEHRAAISKSLIGNTRTLGYKHRPESKRKISEAHLGNSYASGGKGRPKTGAALEAVRRNLAKARLVRQERKTGKDSIEEVSVNDKGS